MRPDSYIAGMERPMRALIAPAQTKQAAIKTMDG
jgi:hypothetical protein